jgi:hypothetical protein
MKLKKPREPLESENVYWQEKAGTAGKQKGMKKDIPIPHPS